MTDPASALTALVDALDDRALDMLADRLAPRLTSDGRSHARPVAYTVATLASEIGLSHRAVRGAVERGELAAVKRGGRWLVSAEAVAAWVTPAPRVGPGVAPARAPRSVRTAPAGSLTNLAARIDRAEDAQEGDQRGQPPVPLTHTNTKRPRQRANATGVMAKGDTPPIGRDRENVLRFDHGNSPGVSV